MRTHRGAESRPPETSHRLLEPPTTVRPSAPARRAGRDPVRAGVLVATAACVLGLGAWASGAFHLASEPPVRSQAVARPLEMFRYAPSPCRTPQPVAMFRHTPRAPAIAQVPDPA